MLLENARVNIPVCFVTCECEMDPDPAASMIVQTTTVGREGPGNMPRDVTERRHCIGTSREGICTLVDIERRWRGYNQVSRISGYAMAKHDIVMKCPREEEQWLSRLEEGKGMRNDREMCGMPRVTAGWLRSGMVSS